jgi:hypothetical protein
MLTTNPTTRIEPANSPARPTQKQLAYLRRLANRAGQTFTYPQTRTQASREIERLKKSRSRGLTFAELQAERAAREANDDTPLAVHDFEVRGWGADATWSQRG